MTSIRDISTLYSSKIDLFDLELIIAHVLKKPREFVLSHPEYNIRKTHNVKLETFIRRRMQHEPLAYILGEKEFYGLNFKVNKNVLVPRPETEQVVELATHNLKHKNNFRNTIVVDIGTGSGNIIVSIAKAIENFQFPISPPAKAWNWRAGNFQLFVVDISAKALKVAKLNAKLHKVDKKIKFLRGDLLEPILKSKILNHKSKIIILANLPYLDKAWRNLLKSSDSKSLKFEPKLALEGGFDGLAAHRRLARQIRHWKAKNERLSATLFCEIGHLQKPGMKKIFQFADKITFHKDLTGRWRVCEVEILSTKSEIRNKFQ